MRFENLKKTASCPCSCRQALFRGRNSQISMSRGPAGLCNLFWDVSFLRCVFTGFMGINFLLKMTCSQEFIISCSTQCLTLVLQYLWCLTSCGTSLCPQRPPIWHPNYTTVLFRTESSETKTSLSRRVAPKVHTLMQILLLFFLSLGTNQGWEFSPNLPHFSRKEEKLRMANATNIFTYFMWVFLALCLPRVL